MFNVTVKYRNVNSKTLFKEINDVAEDCIVNLSIGLRWTNEIHRESLLYIIEEWLENVAEQGKISQYNVICDHRNNTNTDFESGRPTITITYKQKHCFNTTTIDYEIDESAEPLLPV